MPPRLVVLVLLIGMGVGLGATSAGRGVQDTERSVLVTVLDKDRAAIRDLTAGDFTIADGDQMREITRVGLAEDPLFVILVVDTTQPPGQTRQTIDLRDGIRAFVAHLRAANPDGRLALVESAGTALVGGGFDESAATVDRRIDRLAPVREIESSLLEAIREAGRMAGEAPARRRAVIAVDFDSVDPRGVTPTDAAAAVEDAGAAFWSISIRSSGQASPPREALLNYLPGRTGGLRQTMVLSRPLPDMMRQLARTLTSQYVVTFRRPLRAPVTTVLPGVSRGATVLMSPWIR